MQATPEKWVHLLDEGKNRRSSRRQGSRTGRPPSAEVHQSWLEMTQKLFAAIKTHAKAKDGRPLSAREIEQKLHIGHAKERTGRAFNRYLHKEGRSSKSRALPPDMLHIYYMRAAKLGWLAYADLPIDGKFRSGGLGTALTCLAVKDGELLSEEIAKLVAQRDRLSAALVSARAALSELDCALQATNSFELLSTAPILDVDEHGVTVSVASGDPVRPKELLRKLEEAAIVGFDGRLTLHPRSMEK